MFRSLLHTLFKITVASLSVLAHFGITAEQGSRSST
jgi:hypothetical protein